MLKDILIQKSLFSLVTIIALASCYQFNEELLIPSSYPLESTIRYDIGDFISFEFWSFYITNWIPQSYPQVEQKLNFDKPKQQLLFLMKSLDDNQVLAFMYTNVITNTYVIHSLFVEDKLSQIAYDPKDYEGVWIITIITLEYDSLIYETVGSLNINYKLLYLNQPKPNSVEFLVGGTGVIKQQYELGIFRGRLSRIFIQEYYRYPWDIYDGTIYWLRLNEYEKKINILPGLAYFDGVIQKEFEFDQFGRKFCLFGWAKYYSQEAYQLTQYLLVRLTIFKNYKDEINIGDEIVKIIVNLDLSNQNNCGYDVISHHYFMPYPISIEKLATNDKITLRQDLPYFQLLTKWHFISFEYGLEEQRRKSQFRLSYYENQQLFTNSYLMGDLVYSNLFINTKYYAIFGGDYTIYKKLKGQLADFKFFSNYQYDLNLNYYCHDNCQTCYGPLHNNCLSCYDDRGRVFLEEYHQCVCPIDQIEINQICKSYSDLFPSLIYDEISLDVQNSDCPFGYFYLPTNQQCIQCPQWNSYNLYCIDCLLNSKNWYIKPICTKDFITQQVSQTDDAYTQQERSVLDYDLYNIDDSYNLNLIEGVYDYCDITEIQFENCFQLDVNHLSSTAFGFCKENRYYYNFKCKLLDAACKKINQNTQKCTECLSGYYLSDESSSCILCPNSCPNCLSLTECLSCQTGFGLINNQCQKCGNFCKVCQYSNEFEIMVCLSCLDNYFYYISLNSQDCRINELTNCLIAFESSESDPHINSLDYMFRPYSGLTFTKCAKCIDGYFFDELYLVCLEGKQKNCNQFYLSKQGVLNQQVCLYGPYDSMAMIYSFVDECPRMKLNCQYCVVEQLTSYIVQNERIPKKVSYSCLVCQNGYYAQKKTGQCLSCPQDLHCLSCFQQNKISKDNWKNDIRAFYRASIDTEFFQHKFTEYGISQNDPDYEILCTICQEGYELHENQCIEICPESCLKCILQNNKNICIKCPQGLKIRNRTLINNQCISCPNNCNLCYERDKQDVHSINPLFNNEEFSNYSYYCISGSNGYFDQELGIDADCEFGPCIKSIVINLNLICNNEEYYQQLNSLETEEQKKSFQQSNILSDQLFSSSSFSQFETQEFYLLANQKSIKQILIKITSQQHQTCSVLDKQQISQNFSSNIFTAIQVELEIFGNDFTTFQFQQQFLIVNFKRVHIEGIKIDIDFFTYGPSILKFKSAFEQTIQLINILFWQDDPRITFQTIMQNAKNVYISNFIVQDCSRQFYIEYFIKIEKIQSKQTVKIENFNVIYSQFWDLHFFWFDLKKDDLVELNYIYIETSLFNMGFINQTNGELRIFQMKISYSDFYSNNGLFLIKNLQYFNFDSLEFISNTVHYGKIIAINNYSDLMNLNFSLNQFKDGAQLIVNDKVEIFYIYIGNLGFYLNKYHENARFIKFTQNIIPNRELIINQLSIVANKFIQQPLQTVFDILEMSLIYLDVISVKIDHLIIQKAYGIQDIVIINSEKLILKQIEIQQHENFKFKGIHELFECLEQSIINEYYYLSISIYDVPIIEITNLIIQKAESINYPIIDIKTSILKTKTKNIIQLSELHFKENLILITNKIKQASLFQISSAEDYQIEIKNSNFEKNIMHQYIQIDLSNSGLLFNFDCQHCTILLIDLNFTQNIAINTFNSIFYIQAKYLSIQNSIFVQNNQFDYLILQPYLYWGFQEDQEIFFEQIQEKFPIKVLTGNGKIVCQEIFIRNVSISNSTGSGLYIILEKEASLKIYDTNISSLSSIYQDDDEDGGAFLIDTSISSSTSIYLQNVNAQDIFCRNRGGLIFIQSGLGKTMINLQDITIKDVYSLKGSIIFCEFSASTKQSQQFVLNHLDMTNSIQGYLRFLNRFSITNSQSLIQLQFERSLFELAYAKLISIKNIILFSLNYESLAIISQTSNLEISNLRISNSTFLNSFLTVNSMKNQSKLRLVDFQVINAEIQHQIPILEKCIQNQAFDQIKQICSNDNSLKESPIDLKYFKNQDSVRNAYCIIYQMNLQQKKQISSLLDIFPQNSQIHISKLQLRNINCTICQKGLVNVKIYDNLSMFVMNSVNFYDNYCGKQSCLNIVKSFSTYRILQSLIYIINEKQYDVKLQKFQCIRNFANKGTCLQIQDIKILIEDSILQNNTAEQQGGSIYVIGHQSFFILNSVIQNNKAIFGGGLFLKDQISQNLIQQETIIHENIAAQFGDNFVQPPCQLSVSIDLKNQLPKIKIIEKDNLLVEQIQIGKYQLFVNNYSNILYVPNGQTMSQYQYFDWRNQVYIGYNLHLRLIPLDAYNNVQENLNNTECQISGRLLIENEDQNLTENFTENFTNFNSVLFSKSDYNFDNITFFLDDQLNMTLQIQFHCNSIFTPIYGKAQEILGYHNNYFLRMNIKSLPCQLGEIKSLFDYTCVLCNATQGLYSLVLNSNTCSQKDDVTTSEIKSAQLKLKHGFWRPYFDTDEISQCINLLYNCNGGWSEGDTSCFQGHIGALCEECDIYNIRGFGHFSTSTKYSCGSCVEQSKNIFVITGISLWTLVSILITVRSNISLNEQMMLKRVISRLISSRVQYHSNFGILIKMITNHLQILSVIFTFKFSSLISIGNVINAISNPIQTMTHSLDCFLKDIFDFEIHYSIILWQIIMPFIYICIFLCIYSFALIILKLKFNLNVITTTLIYMYIYLQPYLVGALISLISYRQISRFLWIQANVSYRYDTQIHYQWLLKFCIPILILIALIIPLYFFISLYVNQNTLNKKSTRQKWGYLYNEYVLEAYYWEVIKIVFKELLIIFVSYYEENVVKKGILLLSLVYIYQELSQKYRPYKSFILNKLDAYSANVCGISIAVGIGIYIDQQSQTYEIQIPCLIILIMLNFQYIMKIFKEIVTSFVEENALLIDNIKDTILIKIPWIQKYKIFKKILQNRGVQKQRTQMRYLKLKKYLLAKAKYMIKCQNNYGVQISSSTKSIN